MSYELAVVVRVWTIRVLSKLLGCRTMEGNMELIVSIADYVGTVMVAYAALSVHHRILHEHKIDNMVYRIMRKEQVTGLIGVVLITAAFVLRLAI